MKRSTLLLICLLVFLALVGGAAAWMYFSPAGALAPVSAEDAVQELLDTTDTAAWRSTYISLCAPETSAFESAETVAGDLFDTAVQGQRFSFRLDSGNASRGAPVYILSAGENDLLRLNARYDKAGRAWKVEPAPLNALHAEVRTLTVTVPEGTAVSVNGIALGEEYITDSRVPYTGISELETQFDVCPYRVTYTVPGIYAAVQVDVSREEGVLLLYSDGTRFDYTVPDAGTHAFRVTAPQEALVTAGGAPLTDAQAQGGFLLHHQLQLDVLPCGHTRENITLLNPASLRRVHAGDHAVRGACHAHAGALCDGIEQLPALHPVAGLHPNLQ